MACSSAFGVFLAVLGALSPRMRIGDCMKCCDCCGGGIILPHDAMNDRLYWVEVLTGEYRGGKFAAWRDRPGQHRPWLVSMGGQYLYLFYADDEIRVIREIIPEE